VQKRNFIVKNENILAFSEKKPPYVPTRPLFAVRVKVRM